MKRVTVIAGGEFNRAGHCVARSLRDYRIEEIKAYMAQGRFGGGTVYTHEGVWQDGETVISEQGYTFVMVLNDPTGEETTGFAEFVRDILHQSTVLLLVEAVDGQFV